MEHCGTVYKFDKEENYNEFVASLKLSEEAKNGFKNAPTGENLLNNNDGTFTQVNYFGDKELKTKFTPGVEQEVPSSHGAFTILFSFEGNTLVQKLTGKDGNETMFIKRQPSDNGSVLKVVYSTNHSDVVGTRYFKRA